MGLLDGMGDFLKTPEGQGLLSAAFGGLAGARRGAPLNSIGNAGLAGLQGYAGALDRGQQEAQFAQQQKMQDQSMQMHQAQMQDYLAQAEQRKAALEREKKRQEFIPNLFTGGASAIAPLSGDSSIGIQPSAGRPAVAPSFDIQKAIGSGLFTPQEIESWAKVPTAGMTEVARTMKGLVNGKEVDQQFDKFGRPVGTGLEQYKAPLMQDLGGNVSALDPYTLQPKAVLPKTMTFGDKNAAATLDLSRQRFAFDRYGGADAGKPKLVDGQWVMAPNDMKPGESRSAGINTNPKMSEDQAKAAGWLVQAENGFGNMKQAMASEKGVERVGTADLVAGVPGLAGVGNWLRSPNRQKFIQGSSSLSESLLRAATGAGVNKDEAKQKVEELTPVFGEDAATTKQKMDAIPLYIESLKMRAGPGAVKADAIGSGKQPTSGAPMKGQVIDGFKFKGGNPADPNSWEKP